jgi:hypothetical protein
MLDKDWLAKHENVVIDYRDDNALHCHLGERGIDMVINEFLDGTYSITILFLERGIIIFQLEIEGLALAIDLSKELLTAWLLTNASHDELLALNKDIRKSGIYKFYLEGEEAMVRYYWQEITTRLQLSPAFIHRTSMLEVVALCLQSSILSRFIPFSSLGKLCLSNTTAREPYSTDCFCLYSIDNKFEVAHYDHESSHLFGNAFEAVEYVERFYKERK